MGVRSVAVLQVYELFEANLRYIVVVEDEVRSR